MIQLNLLPDVKIEYLKAERTRRLAIAISIVVTVVAVVITVLLLLVDFAQKKHISDLSSDITTKVQTLKNKPNISEILSLQNQIKSLPTLLGGEQNASALFSSYLDEITPNHVAINNLQADFNAHTLNLSGTADSITTINQYVDTLKDATYTSASVPTATPAFSSVVLTSFGIDSNATDLSQAASYNVTFVYDPSIFSTTGNVKLAVPSKDTTRAQSTPTNDLFEAAPASSPAKAATGGN